MKDLPGGPVLEGLMLVDVLADAIFKTSERGTMQVDYEAMAARDAARKAAEGKGGGAL